MTHSTTIELPTNWDDAAISKLIERLYLVGRRCREIGMHEPCFVLPARNRESRENLERCIFAHLHKQYGFDHLFRHIDPKHSGEAETVIHFPKGNVTLVLMDV